MADIITYRALLGRHIADIRKARGASQEDLAEQLHISRTYMGYIEQGVRTPSLETLLDISESLDVTMPELLDFVWMPKSKL